ncbi:multicomponent Na+:H+ antiporter subunit B [Pelagirhabdus alkalitolerans]|uniref:Multicomponent Na+:H+ antiporter subunit B n=1 Tax=Pelagirhabdus alkalitolerans TaxID=1612202 RepID=A0A1G6H812_9BACI|nr:hydrogen gas-evolving membrane-bound hydrogenase subunit E [Pelagirhabdus alkalitolerans]SDB90427.1 multicomponent Na+:H+ antiporter subunit B [Pelagirhabdus alkalitolerans]
MRKIFTFIMLGGLLVVLLSSISELPPMGNGDNPSFNEISEYYIDEGVEDTHAPNLITAIITDYRAFDTLGEATVLFTGIAAVVSLIGITHHSKNKEDEEDDLHG